MNKYDICCPLCGKANRNLYLDETEGWMECEGCGRVAHVKTFGKAMKLPIIRIPLGFMEPEALNI